MIEDVNTNVLGSKQQNIFDEVISIYEANKDKLTNEESEVIKYLDQEMLQFASIGYGSIERSFKFQEHSLLRAKRIALHYEKQGFVVELSKLPFGEFKILISWTK